MSGGVDSSVAACLLLERGYDVMGLFMRTGVSQPEVPVSPTVPLPLAPNSTQAAPPVREHRGCCSASDAADARFVAGMLDIPFYALNFESEFDELIDYFADEYVNGRTPNPCVVCNDRLKFGKILNYADAVGAKYIATGHYARTETRGGRTALLRGCDAKKDQSYVLFGLSRTVLDRVLFPIGDLEKSEVRAIATKYNLPNRDKPDSVEICFVPDQDYARVVRERRPDSFREGDVLDHQGKVIGTHKGVGHYTIGQRRGLGIAAGTPIYVNNINAETNTVTMGDADSLLAPGLMAERVNFLVDPPARKFSAQVKIRYLHRAAPATIHLIGDGREASEEPVTVMSHEDSTPTSIGDHELSGSRAGRTAVAPRENLSAKIIFDEPQRAITPGQAVVLYDGDLVIGGGWITGPVV